MPSVRLTLTPRDSQNTSTSTSTTDSTQVWIILAAIAALLTLGACSALFIISFSKRRLLKRQLDGEARRLDPGLAIEKFSSRKRKMTAEDMDMEAESTRTAMIRKSLASRSGRSASFATSDCLSTTERPESSNYGDGQRYDWKDFEAGLSRHSSAASLRGSTPSPLPELPAPSLSRSSSPSRNPLLAGRAELPPPLEQHPCLRS
ncbi:hypothetical protein diail_10056 [Diaporthe ilicicola]|nr:hypothetical protein diail_10056 [Diaporthe ilicicola]